MTSISRRAFVLGLSALAAGLTGCGEHGTSRDPADQDGSAQTGQATQTITDMEGTAMEVPYDLQHVAITSWKGAIGAFALLGQCDRISVCCSTSRYRWLRHAVPSLGSLPDYGSFNDVSVEEMLAAKPDVVISPQQGSGGTQKLRDVGLVVAVDGVTPTDASDVMGTARAERSLVARMTHTEDLLASYDAWEKSLLDEIARRVADIPDAERRRVLVTRGSMEEVFCANMLFGYGVTLAGGKLVTKDINKYFTTVNTEEVVQWAPEVIFQQVVSIEQDTMGGIYRGWAADERYRDIPAIRTGDVYLMPMGITQWAGDEEFSLGVLLMAKLLYPDRFADMDVLSRARDFYSTFMHYELTDEDHGYLFVDMDGAKPLGVV